MFQSVRKNTHPSVLTLVDKSIGLKASVFPLSTSFHLNFKYVVSPRRRSSAKGLNGALNHVVGGILSPYLMGALSDSLRGSLITEEEYCSHLLMTTTDGNSNTTALQVDGDLLATRCQASMEYHSMQYSIATSVLAGLLAAVCNFICALTILTDKKKALEDQREENQAREMEVRVSLVGSEATRGDQK